MELMEVDLTRESDNRQGRQQANARKQKVLDIEGINLDYVYKKNVED